MISAENIEIKTTKPTNLEMNSQVATISSTQIMTSQQEDDVLRIYTDGACSGNPGVGGWGAVLIYKGTEKEISGADPHTTNNRMELLAVIKALECVTRPIKIVVYSDSSYVINGFKCGWISSWQRNNWLNSARKPVSNKELWQRLLVLVEKYQVSFVKVKGHSTDKYNNRCDALAVQAWKDYKRTHNLQ